LIEAVLSQPVTCDVAIVGGGLAGGLIALALTEKRPDLDVRIIEAQHVIGGNHVWSFFDSDIAPANRWLIEPLISHSWKGYDIAFPAHARTLDAVYNSIESEQLNHDVKAKLGRDKIILGCVEEIRERTIILADKTKISARYVVDARGPGDLKTLKTGWQKFVGQSLKVSGGHGLTRPIVMDATVDQIDGYRFIYCLPFDAETVFVEDTYYSDTPDLDLPAIRARIAEYVGKKGWQTSGNAREETGVLPVVMGGDFDAYWNSTGPHTAKAGLRSGMFHATTGYSLPNAVRLAVAMPDLVDLAPDAFAMAVKAMARDHWQAGGFYRLLDAMLFDAAEPAKRYKVLERFYALSPALIARFYAGQSRLADKIRILSGKPPVPIGKAIRAIIKNL
jgi:lycopene beta-cyclase